MQQSEAAVTVRVTVTLRDGVASALVRAAGRERRSVSSQAAVLIEAGLDAGGVGTDGVVPVAVVAPPASSPAVEGGSTPLPVVVQAGPGSREMGSRPGSACSFDTPHGVKCKACGKTH